MGTLYELVRVGFSMMLSSSMLGMFAASRRNRRLLSACGVWALLSLTLFLVSGFLVVFLRGE